MDFNFTYCIGGCTPSLSYITRDEDYIYSKLNIDENNSEILFTDVDGNMITTIIFELDKYRIK